MTRKGGTAMKRRNGGYTLVELMVVIAILGVLATMAVLSLSVISSTGARQCANQIDAKLSECKINCMSRANAQYLCIYVDGGKVRGDYVEGGVSKDEVLSSKQVTISYQFGEESPVELGEGDGLYVAFDRASGGLRTFSAADTTPITDPAATAIITVTGGLRSYTIVVDALTGAHMLKG